MIIRKKIVFLFLFSLICASGSMVYGSLTQIKLSAEIGNIEVNTNSTFEGKPAVEFRIYNVKVYGALGKQIHFGFNISQNKSWLANAWLAYAAENVKYEVTEWKGPLVFSYFKEFLSTNGNAKLPFYGSFFVVDTAAGKEFARKDVEFSINASGTSTTTSTSTTTNDMSTDDSVSASEKNFGAYMDEAVGRLLENPDIDYYKWDPWLFGAWEGLDLDYKNWKVMDKYIEFNQDGTGYFEIIPLYLMKNGTLQAKTAEAVTANFYWMIEVVYTDAGEPVTLVRVVSQADTNDIAWYGYVVFDQKKMGMMYWDQEKGRYDQLTHFSTKSDFDADWKKNSSKLAKAFNDAYKAKKEADTARLITEYMGWNMAWMGVMGAAGAWFAAPAVY